MNCYSRPPPPLLPPPLLLVPDERELPPELLTEDPELFELEFGLDTLFDRRTELLFRLLELFRIVFVLGRVVLVFLIELLGLDLVLFKVELRRILVLLSLVNVEFLRTVFELFLRVSSDLEYELLPSDTFDLPLSIDLPLE